jgi:beta-phosphoglucomutase
LSVRYDAVLFDFDGVLADTEPVHYQCWAEILAPLGIELTWDRYAADYIGASDEDMLAQFAAMAPSKPGMRVMRELYDRKQTMFRECVLADNPCPPETVALVRSLTEYRVAVVTSSGRREVEPVLVTAGILSILATAVYGEDVERHKPAPDPYLLAASRIGASRPLVVEDSEPGVASAKAAGFDVIRVTGAADVPRMVAGFLRSS